MEQDIILSKISKSKFENNITIKGGVVMHSISNSVCRATRDLDFIKYSLEDIYFRLKSIFKSNAYKKNLTEPKNNWLDIPINTAIDSVLNYIEELSKKM